MASPLVLPPEYRIPVVADENNKGGVGKTFSSVNGVTRLKKKYPDKKFLLVDGDSNMTATEITLGPGYDAHNDKNGAKRNLLDVMITPKQGFDNAIVPYFFDKNDPTLSVDIVPGSKFIESVSTRFDDPYGNGPISQPVDDVMLVMQYLMLLPAIQQTYAAVFFDVGPGQNVIMEILLRAASHTLIPVEAAIPSVRGLMNFGERVGTTNRNRANSHSQLVSGSTLIAGVLISRFKPKSSRQQLCAKQIREGLAQIGVHCFGAQIPESDDEVDIAIDANVPVWTMFPNEPISQAIDEFVTELAQMLHLD